MNIKETKNAVKEILKSNLQSKESLHIVPILMSLPGIGKTSIMECIAKELGIELRTVVLAQFDSGELGGFPVLSEDRAVYKRAKPFFMDFEKGSKGIIFLDELPQAPVANQNIAAQLVNERRIGEHMMPEGWILVCAGNPLAARAGTNAMPSHLRDRLTFLHIEADTESFLDYAYQNDFGSEVTGFLEHRPSFLSNFDPNVEVNTSPRSWERADTILKMGLPKALEKAVLNGQIGTAASADFAGYLKVSRELPNPRRSLANPDTVVIPKSPQILYAFCAGLAEYVSKDTTAALVQILSKFKKKEFAAMTIRALCKRNPDLINEKEISDWIMTEGRELTL